MTRPDLALATLSLLLVTATWVNYFRRVPSGNVPARPVGSIAAQGAGLVLAALALVVAGFPPGVAVPVLAGSAALFAALFLWLLTQRATPVGDLRVAVGDRVLAFTAPRDTGAAFHTDELLGKRTLLKFFRGSW